MLVLVRASCLAIFLLAARSAGAIAAPSAWGVQGQGEGVESTPAAEDGELGELRVGLEAARGAREAGDHDGTRSRILETVDVALGRLERRQDAAILSFLGELGLFAQVAGELRASERVARAVLSALERTLPADHADLLRWRGNLSATLHALGDLDGARVLREAVLAGFERTLPADHPNTLRARRSLAETLRALGDLAGARVLQEAALAGAERTMPEDHPDLLAARGGLAATLRELGDLAGARVLQVAVLAARERTLPEGHPQLLWSRTNLAATLASLGDLVGARAIEEAVLKAWERTVPEGHPDLLRAQNNLAATLFVLGDLAGAEALLTAVLAARERTLPEDHPDLLGARGNLAATKLALSDFAGARVLQEEVLEACEQALPDGHPQVLQVQQNLATTLRFLGDFDGARVLQAAVLEARERTLSEDHPDLLGARGNLAATLQEIGNLSDARMLQEAVLAGCERTLPHDHPDLLWARANLARTLAEQVAQGTAGENGEGRTSEMDENRGRLVELTSAISSSLASNARMAVLSGSAREAEERLAQLDSSLSLTLSLALGSSALEGLVEQREEVFLAAEKSRGAALAVAALTRGAREAAEYDTLRAELRRASEDLAQSGAGAQEFHAARNRRERAERELVALALEWGGEARALLEFDLQALANRLGNRAAAVSIRGYTRWKLEIEESSDGTGAERVRDSQERSLCAFVALGAGPGEAARLELVDLGSLAAIEEAVRGWRLSIAVDSERGLGLEGAGDDAARDTGSRLARAVWAPLVPHLADAERVIVALDDVLHLVPLDALPWGEGDGRIGERWRIETRVALWEVLAPRSPVFAGGALVALGGASFNSAPQGMGEAELAALDEAEAASGVQVAMASHLRGGAWERGFAPLTYTGPEARGVAALFEEVHEDAGRALVLERRKASRAALEAAAPRARWLHVATHGWFAPESIRSWSDRDTDGASARGPVHVGANEVVRGMSPMLLCGLALAGANQPADMCGRVPGLMTAEELSTLDLARCELAVLSACDTNVGERRAGQGVASLQRALHMAGAKSVVTSLWKVPDGATAELMLDFYRRLWVEGKSKQQALWEAKLRLRDALDERGAPLYTTRDWAAWVLTGEQE